MVLQRYYCDVAAAAADAATIATTTITITWPRLAGNGLVTGAHQSVANNRDGGDPFVFGQTFYPLVYVFFFFFYIHIPLPFRSAQNRSTRVFIV